VEQDQREFAEFYTAAWEDCLRIVMVSVGDRPLAEDLVADAFTKAWTSWRKVRGHAEPRAWVIRSALNAHVSWWRRHRREVALGGHDSTAAARQDVALDSSLVAALRRLPVRQRQVIALRLLLDLDTATTAEMLGMSSGTVATHLHRGIAALRREISPLSDKELSR
jgi:RNA polymerase sigma-70 factor (sigma-E family)